MTNPVQAEINATTRGASRPIGGALTAFLPAPASSVGKTDKAIARSTSTKLLNALKTTHDPQLKATFSQALASLNQHLAQGTREAKGNQAPKVSTKDVLKVKPPKKK